MKMRFGFGVVLSAMLMVGVAVVRICADCYGYDSRDGY